MIQAAIANVHMPKPNPDLIELEARTGLGPTKVAKLLGVHYTAYAGYRAGRRPWPVYHQRHVEALLQLSKVKLEVIMKEHVWPQ